MRKSVQKIESNSNLLNEYLLYEILFSPNTMDDFKILKVLYDKDTK